MKKKIRLQKIIILSFMSFAVFNYNNCELSNKQTNGDEVVEDNTEIDDNSDSTIEVGDEKIIGEDSSRDDDEDANEDGESTDTAENETEDSTVSLTSSEIYNLKLEAYTDSNLHLELQSCSSCHVGSFSGGAHGESDPETSMQDLLYYYSSGYNQTGKVDFSDTSNSVIYKKALTGHMGANSSNILSYINTWVSDYDALAEAALAEKILAIEEGEEVEVEEDNGDSLADTEGGAVWRTIDDLNIFSDVILMPTAEATISFTIDNVGVIDITVDYDAEQGHYLLKDPTLTLISGGSANIKEMRCLVNEELQIRYGTWSSINETFDSGDIIGHGTLFIEAEDPGNDSIKLGFIELSE